MKKMKIEIGDFYTVHGLHVGNFFIIHGLHVKVVRPLGVNGWEVVSTYRPADKYVVTEEQLEPEPARMRAWRRWGRPS